MTLFKRNLSRRFDPESERFQDIGTLEQRLWKLFEVKQAKTGGAKTFACLIGFCGPNLDTVMNLLRDVGVQRTMLFADIPQLYENINLSFNRKNNQEEFTHVFINLDSFRSLECGIDLLLDFRKIFNSARIILTSEHAVRNNFGDEKNSICDVTLSLPLSSESLNLAINSG